jgi:hydroxymethylpyrimidine/phosphomethylpyrimidine kinase
VGYRLPSVLSIAGSDSSGGAGIQADIKTIEAMGLFAQTVITSLTAQNTMGVRAVADVDPDFVSAQIDAVFDDIRPDAVKVGMVSSAAIVHAIAEGLKAHRAEHVVVDPVMVATSGARLMADDAVSSLVGELFPLADLITPNLDETAVLCGFDVESRDDMEQAARELAERSGTAVLVKGGHAAGDADDVLCADGRCVWVSLPRVDNPNTHGTGCTLSSAIACGLAQGKDVEAAVRDAKGYLQGALVAGLAMGKGHGPIDHMWRMRRP